MADKNKIQRQIENLEKSKYDTRWEAFKGFVKAALPAVITFTAIGVAVAAMGVGLGMIFNSALIESIGAGKAILMGAGAIGGGAALLAGGASAMRSGSETRERNNTITEMEEELTAKAKEMGVTVSIPSKEQEAANNTVAFHQEQNTQGRPQFLENILEKERDRFDPKKIISRAAEDARESVIRH